MPRIIHLKMSSDIKWIIQSLLLRAYWLGRLPPSGCPLSVLASCSRRIIKQDDALIRLDICLPATIRRTNKAHSHARPELPSFCWAWHGYAPSQRMSSHTHLVTWSDSFSEMVVSLNLWLKEEQENECPASFAFLLFFHVLLCTTILVKLSSLYFGVSFALV